MLPLRLLQWTESAFSHVASRSFFGNALPFSGCAGAEVLLPAPVLQRQVALQWLHALQYGLPALLLLLPPLVLQVD